ncbi:UNVERIFIED_CONTAM: hypothetical protein Slati_4293200 [Sesamum latifolium]|uniref:DUF4283 domain-containing protein n=1 Tax=Sesamum latifolium TaxID=2727402 RepID=A0AAW2TEQ5_9LAMI
MAKAKKSKHSTETSGRTTMASDQLPAAPVSVKAKAAEQFSTTAIQSVFVKGTSMPTDKTKVGPLDFHAFISDLEASPSPMAKNFAHTCHVSNTTGPQIEETLPGKAAVSEADGTKKTSFSGLFSTNQKPTTENKLAKLVVEDGTLTLESTDLVNIQAKLGHCLVGYVAGKFLGLKAIRALAQSWGPSFQQHDSGWLIFRFARDEDRQRILAGGPYFIYGRPLLLKNMPDCFEFKEDDVSLTPVWAILPSLPNVGTRMHLAKSGRDWVPPLRWIH